MYEEYPHIIKQEQGLLAPVSEFDFEN